MVIDAESRLRQYLTSHPELHAEYQRISSCVMTPA
jgi:hypothetical protein